MLCYTMNCSTTYMNFSSMFRVEQIELYSRHASGLITCFPVRNLPAAHVEILSKKLKSEFLLKFHDKLSPVSGLVHYAHGPPRLLIKIDPS